jgi:hypothetical protein
MLIGAFGVWSTAVVAAPISMAFSGVITERPASPDDLDASIQVGSLFSGILIVDPDDVQPAEPQTDFTNTIRYPLAPSGSLIVTVAGIEFTEQIAAIFVHDDSEWVAYPGSPVDAWETQVSDSEGLFVNVRFQDHEHSKLSSADFFVNDTLQGWTSAVFQIDNAIGILAIGEITSVPEPRIGLALAATVAVAWCHRRARARRLYPS